MNAVRLPGTLLRREAPKTGTMGVGQDLTVVADEFDGRTSFAKRAMQSETALRFPALAMQLSNVVKTFVLRAMNVPKRTASTMPITSATRPHTSPAMAGPEFVAPSARPRVTAMPPRMAATRPPSRPREKGRRTRRRPGWPRREPGITVAVSRWVFECVCYVRAGDAADVTVRSRFPAGPDYSCVTWGGRGSFLSFVRTHDTATTAVASIEDAAECGERADALVSGLLAGVMRQRRTVATAMDYVRALSRETRANAWELARKAGHEGPHLIQSLLSRRKWRGRRSGRRCRSSRRRSCAMTRTTRSAPGWRSTRPLTCGRGSRPRASRRSTPG